MSLIVGVLTGVQGMVSMGLHFMRLMLVEQFHVAREAALPLCWM